MTDERLRAQLRKAKETGEWMQYLVAAQRAGISLEDALLETKGAAIELIQTHSDALYRFSDDVEAKITQWMTLAEGIPNCTYHTLNVQPELLVWTYLVLDRIDKARKHRSRWEHKELGNPSIDTFFKNPKGTFHRNSERMYNLVFHGTLRHEIQHQRRLIARNLRNGNLPLAEEFTPLLSEEDKFLTYLDLSFTLKNKEYKNDRRKTTRVRTQMERNRSW
ncbi:hypothetical protein J4219_07885 [Candidatus Woesearchaeota archaeon]|nr:hypothetical protein [Candidatus Woesearchaeota archaeon]